MSIVFLRGEKQQKSLRLRKFASRKLKMKEASVSIFPPLHFLAFNGKNCEEEKWVGTRVIYEIDLQFCWERYSIRFIKFSVGWKFFDNSDLRLFRCAVHINFFCSVNKGAIWPSSARAPAQYIFYNGDAEYAAYGLFTFDDVTSKITKFEI